MHIGQSGVEAGEAVRRCLAATSGGNVWSSIEEENTVGSRSARGRETQHVEFKNAPDIFAVLCQRTRVYGSLRAAIKERLALEEELEPESEELMSICIVVSLKNIRACNF